METFDRMHKLGGMEIYTFKKDVFAKGCQKILFEHGFDKIIEEKLFQ